MWQKNTRYKNKYISIHDNKKESMLFVYTECKQTDWRVLSVVETFLCVVSPCDASLSTFIRTVWPLTPPPNRHSTHRFVCCWWHGGRHSVLNVNMPKQVGSARLFCRPQQMRQMERSANIDARSWNTQQLPSEGTENFTYIVLVSAYS